MSTQHHKHTLEKEDAGGAEEGERRASTAAPHPRDLALFLPYACKQLQASFSVKVTPLFQEEILVPETRRRASRQPAPPSSPAAAPGSRSASACTGASFPPDEALPLAAVHDAAGALVELAARRTALPCILLKLLAVSAPHQTRLTRLTLRGCRLDARALHQLCELLPSSNITDLCLNDSPVNVGGYHLLLQRPSNLACLHLDRCALGDYGVAAIAECLHYPRPAASTLRVLSLATNGAGDTGARALGAALRSNRALQHLNLADNRIGDDGAARIFDSLAEFKLTKEEMLGARRRMVERLRRRQSVFARVLSELQAERARPSATSMARGRRRGTVAVSASALGSDTLAARAEAATDQLMGPSAEPYSADNTRPVAGKVFCTGNVALRWLDLAYNGLGQASLEALRRVLSYQMTLWAPTAPPPGGLLRVVLAGDPLPDSEELFLVAARLEEALDRAAQRPSHRQTFPGKGRK